MAAPVAAASTGAPAAAPRARRTPRRLVPPRLLPRRRLAGTWLAVAGAAALAGTVLYHLPGPDAATPLTGGPYTTPSPYAGGAVALQPLQLDPSSPAALITPAPLSSQAPRAVAAPPPSRGGTAPAPAPTIRQSPALVTPATQPPLPPPPDPGPSAPPTAAPTATAVPSATPGPSATATPTGPVAVHSIALSVGTCHDQGGWWICPETTVFTFDPGSAGTLIYSIGGTDVSCTGTSSAYDQPQKQVAIPAGTVKATVTSALVFPASNHPAATGPGSVPSTAVVRVTSPNRISSASEPFGSAACP
jgi:hypothetical protein